MSTDPSSAVDAYVLSRLIHRLPPTLSILFENPVEKDPNRVISLAWVSEDSSAGAGFSDICQTAGYRGFYLFVVGLRYQARYQKYSLLLDSGPVVVALHVDSILVTIGDIAQVWSNGKLKKVRGRAISTSDSDGHNNSSSASSNDTIAMTLLMTRPLESIVSPLPRKTVVIVEQIGTGSEDGRRVFDSFSFEDYAWEVYHDCLISPEDPLDRHRLT